MEQLLELYQSMGISPRVYEYGEDTLNHLKERFALIDQVAEHNQAKVLWAMQKNRVSAACFAATTGYGYDDLGRDAIEELYAQVFEAEDALVRHSIISGTQALSICLFGVLRPGDRLVSLTGKPYDTLQQVIGGEGVGSLKDFGVNYSEVALKDGKPDYDAIRASITDDVKMVLIQRSKGYEWRDTLSVADIENIVKDNILSSIEQSVNIITNTNSITENIVFIILYHIFLQISTQKRYLFRDTVLY